jgi:hypothetical protein
MAGLVSLAGLRIPKPQSRKEKRGVGAGHFVQFGQFCASRVPGDPHINLDRRTQFGPLESTNL